MTRAFLLLCLLLTLSACDPRNACRSYGFVDGTTAMAQCVQNEIFEYRRQTQGRS